MKIALAQLNYHIGNFEYNKKQILEHIQKAKEDQADLVVFSEMSVCGYPPQDLLDYQVFVDQCDKTVKEIAEHCYGIAAILGGPRLNPNPKGKMLLNSAFFIEEGQIKSVQDKTLLPTYDIFDEYRYFEQNKKFDIIEYKGHRIAMTVCEDLWDDQPYESLFGRRELYTVSPMKKLQEHNPDLLINIAASPFSYTKIWGKKNIFMNKAKEYNLPVFYVNQTGAQTELIFEGASLAVHPKGTIKEELNWFSEDYRVIDLNSMLQNGDEHKTHDSSDYIEKIYHGLILGLQDFFRKLDFKKAIVGLSGGIDSAVVLAIAANALGTDNVQAMLLPSDYSSKSSVTDAEELANNLGVKYNTVAINKIVNSFDDTLSELFKGTNTDTTEENIQARIRGTLLMAVSNKFGNILLNTSNKSESAVGYATLYGDMNGAVSVLGDVYKTDVYKLAEFINTSRELIPKNILQKAPSAELKPDQKDSDSLPEYEVLDKILFDYIELQRSIEDIVEERDFDRELVEKIIRMVNNSEYKRYQAPPVLRISSKAFGVGRRMPLVARY
jgi:NAD+ synthase (glutamine-hydrolysing)